MDNAFITGAQFRDMVAVGAALLEKKRTAIDELNVFPVPDGDTGTNMCMTMRSAVKEMGKLSHDPTVTEVADAISVGALRGARGNSGVILSQIFRGFSKALKGAKEMDAELYSKALTKAMESAYKAVVRPKEGTILTVSKAIAKEVESAREQGANVYRLVDVAVEAGRIALAKTPEQLPVLKEAGVVDSGGKGLVTVYKGFKLYLDGKEVAEYEEEMESAEAAPSPDSAVLATEEIKYGYCTEFCIIHLNERFRESDLDGFIKKMSAIGDSVNAVYDNGMVKIHVHTNAPGQILQMALRYGELDNLKIENMREENRQILEERKKNEKESAIIAVCSGAGLEEIFREMGVDEIVTGGQTMNPSIDSFVQAIRKVNARTVYILPNNSNIILAAQQSAPLVDSNVRVIPTKTILQGITALMNFDPSHDADFNEKAMTESLTNVISGSVTFAARDSSISGQSITKGDILGLMGKEIASTGKDLKQVAEKLFDAMVVKKGSNEGTSMIFFGEDVEESEAVSLAEKLEKKYPGIDFTVQSGGQPLYYYYLSLE